MHACAAISKGYSLVLNLYTWEFNPTLLLINIFVNPVIRLFLFLWIWLCSSTNARSPQRARCRRQPAKYCKTLIRNQILIRLNYRNVQLQNTVSSPVTRGLVLWRYLGEITGICFPPVWVNKGALGGSQACSSHLLQAHVNPRSATCCVWRLFSIPPGETKSFSKENPQTNK